MLYAQTITLNPHGLQPQEPVWAQGNVGGLVPASLRGTYSTVFAQLARKTWYPRIWRAGHRGRGAWADAGNGERTEWCAMEREGFFERTYELVRQIPRGRVASYGQIAAMLGQPRKARFVGFAMHASPGQAAGVPCHRVVFKDGSLAAGYAFGGPSVQRQLLEEEGIVFLPDGRVDMSTCRWEA